MSAKKPIRVFTAIEENPSLGDNGPIGLKTDIDMINKMFDPDATHDTGEPGGIQVGNIAHDSIGNTGGAGDANKIVQFKSDGSLPGNIDTSNNAVNAVNVTTNINGHAISDIFEEDGVTVKKATSATSAESCIGNSATATDATKLNGKSGDWYAKIALPLFTITNNTANPIAIHGILINTSTGALTGLNQNVPKNESYSVPPNCSLIYLTEALFS